MNREQRIKRNYWTFTFSALILALALVILLLQPGEVTGAETELYIVQGTSVPELVTAVERVGGEVTHELGVIQAVGAELTLGQMVWLQAAPQVSTVWADTKVQSIDSADPGVIYSPEKITEYKPSGFDLDKVTACDGSRDGLSDVPTSLDPNLGQFYTFSLPASSAAPSLHLEFMEKGLSKAQLEVYQTSTDTWHDLQVPGLALSEDETMVADFDLSNILTTPEDFTNFEIAFSAEEGNSDKAEVDCLLITTNGGAFPPVSGQETKPNDFDIEKALENDGSREDFNDVSENGFNPHLFQEYTFPPITVDPTDLPGLVDLEFEFKEKDLVEAQLWVLQASTQIWHPFEINVLQTNDEDISVVLDLTTILENEADFDHGLRVRFLPVANGGNKAEVDYMGIRVASLVGETLTEIVSDSFEAVNAAPVWAAGNTGQGIGVAVLDSGVKKYNELKLDTQGNKTGYVDGYSALDGKNKTKDQNGHGTIVASIISNVEKNENQEYHGVAPDTVIIPVQVLDKDGVGSYTDVINGIQWVIDHKDEYNIRVLNMSLSAPVQSYYWEDPLNQAVMQAWQAGIVVVVGAGNSGPDPMTIGVPGNVPYVITVGAMTDDYTPTDWDDDYLPTFSSAGPT